MVWARMQWQWKGKKYCLSIPEKAEKKLFAQCIFRCDFPFPRTTIVLGIENYPSTCMSCCSDELALLLPRLDLWSRDPRINFRHCRPLIEKWVGQHWITKFLSRKFTLTPIWRVSRNFWTTKIWSYTVTFPLRTRLSLMSSTSKNPLKHFGVKDPTVW